MGSASFGSDRMNEPRARPLRRLANVLGVDPWLQLMRRPPASSRKSGELIHGLEDVPPPLVVLFQGFQHVSLVRIQLIYPALVIQLADLPTAASVNMLSLALIALGIASILQSLPRGPVGSR